MTISSVTRIVAFLGITALAACGGGGAGNNYSALPNHAASRIGPDSILTRIVGVGDSLTAGYQADGFLGQIGVKNPYNPPTALPPTQENGWWAELVEQASGLPLDAAIAAMYDPATSQLPLIKGPGLDNLLAYYGILPFHPLKSGNACVDNGGFNEAGYRLKGVPRVRMDAEDPNIRDVGIPGLTLHEANVLHQPQTSTCKSIPGIPGLLNQVISEESGTFWPVMYSFRNLPRLTPVNAAASLHPTLATVWLGANDVLKYMGSGGRFVGGDHNAAQAESDLRQAISTLKKAGARVVVANLPDVLETGYFQRAKVPSHKSACRYQSFGWCFFALDGIQALFKPLVEKFGLTTPTGCIPASITRPCGYLTLQGVQAQINYVTYQKFGVADLDCAVPEPHCKSKPGSGLGVYYITPAFAAKVQVLNDAINQGIDNAARAEDVPLVDIHTIFAGLASGNPSNPYFKEAASINPGLCCTLGFLWGISSFDGIHPSNTGYALIASAFIQTINAAYGTHIPPIDVKAVYEGTRCSTKHYCFPDPYAPPNDSPYTF